MFVRAVERLSSQLALVSKALDKNAGNIEGALHVPTRPKRRKRVPTLFAAVDKYRPGQAREEDGRFADEGKGTEGVSSKPPGLLRNVGRGALIGLTGGMASYHWRNVAERAEEARMKGSADPWGDALKQPGAWRTKPKPAAKHRK